MFIIKFEESICQYCPLSPYYRFDFLYPSITQQMRIRNLTVYIFKYPRDRDSRYLPGPAGADITIGWRKLMARCSFFPAHQSSHQVCVVLFPVLFGCWILFFSCVFISLFPPPPHGWPSVEISSVRCTFVFRFQLLLYRNWGINRFL